MSDKIEYFRSPDSAAGGIVNANAYKIVDKAGAGYFWSAGAKVWHVATPASDVIRQRCTQVPTEYEAIHGEPEPVLYYAAWKEGEPVNRTLGKPTHPAAYRISEGRLWSYGKDEGCWKACGTDPDGEFIQKCIAFFKANYQPCTEAEALASIGLEPAKPKRRWFECSAALYVHTSETESQYILKSEGTWGQGAETISVRAEGRAYNDINESRALEIIAEKGWDLPPGCEDLTLPEGKLKYPRYFKSHSGGVYQVVADETVAYWNCVKHTWEAVAGCKLSRLFKMPEITEAEAKELVDEPEPPKFAVGMYLQGPSGIRRVITLKEYGLASLPDGTLYLLAADGSKSWGAPANQNKAYSPWLPAEGLEVWDVDHGCMKVVRKHHGYYWLTSMDGVDDDYCVDDTSFIPASFAPKEPAVEDDHVKHEKVAAKRKGEAWDCEFFLEEYRDTPCLWHRCKCRNSGENGDYDPCDLVWKGNCTRKEPAEEEHPEQGTIEQAQHFPRALTKKEVAESHAALSTPNGEPTLSEPAEELWPVGTRVRDVIDGELGTICSDADYCKDDKDFNEGDELEGEEGFVTVRFDNAVENGEHCRLIAIDELARLPEQDEQDEPTQENAMPDVTWYYRDGMNGWKSALTVVSESLPLGGTYTNATSSWSTKGPKLHEPKDKPIHQFEAFAWMRKHNVKLPEGLEHLQAEMDKQPTQGPAPADIHSPQGRKDQTMETQLLEWAEKVNCPSCDVVLIVSGKRLRRKLDRRRRVFRGQCPDCKTLMPVKAKNYDGEEHEPEHEGDRNMIARSIIRWLVRRLIVKVALVGGFAGGVATGVAYPEQSALAGAALKAALMYFWT